MNYDSIGFTSWIIIGAIAGWFASRLAGSKKQRGCVFNIILGIIGALIGGYVFNYFGKSGVTGINIYSIFVATVGAVILLFVSNLFSSKD